MKQKFLLASLIVFGCISSSKAQISKGSVWVGGGLAFNESSNSQQNDDRLDRTLIINPGIGLTVKDNLVVGVELNYYKNTQELAYDFYRYTNRSVGGGVFVRTYLPVVNRFYFFTQAGASVAGIRSTATRASALPEKGKGWSADLYLTPGISFAIKKHLHLESGLGSLLSYSSSKVKYEQFGKPDRTTKNTAAGLSSEANAGLYVGVRFLL